MTPLSGAEERMLIEGRRRVKVGRWSKGHMLVTRARLVRRQLMRPDGGKTPEGLELAERLRRRDDDSADAGGRGAQGDPATGSASPSESPPARADSLDFGPLEQAALQSILREMKQRGGMSNALRYGTVWLHRAPALREPCQVPRASMDPVNRRRSRTAMGQREGRRPRAVGRALVHFLDSAAGRRLYVQKLADQGHMGVS